MSYTQVLEEIKKWDIDQKWLLLEIANALYGSIRPSDWSIPDDEEVRRILNEERYAKYG